MCMNDTRKSRRHDEYIHKEEASRRINSQRGNSNKSNVKTRTKLKKRKMEDNMWHQHPFFSA
jgi:hypothetical protein